jgi:RNA processing factor Prp31
MKIFSAEELQLLRQMVKDELNADVNLTDAEDILAKINAIKDSIKKDINNMSNDEIRKYIQKIGFLNSLRNKLEEEIQKEAQERSGLIATLQSLL